MTPAEQASTQTIVWAVVASGEVHPPAHPAPKPIVGRLVELACEDKPVTAPAIFPEQPRDRDICKVCHKAMFDEDKRPR